MSAFELTVELKSPLVFGHNPIRLDGLLWHCLFLECGCPDKAKERLADYLAFNGRIYHASSAGLGVIRQPMLLDDGGDNQAELVPDVHALNRTAIGSMGTESDLNEMSFLPNGVRKNQPYIKVMVEGGPYINRLNTFKAYWANALVFHGAGQGGAIADLLGFYLSAVGVNANIGFGTIGKVKAKAIPNDLSLIGANGQVARPLPIDSAVQPTDPKKHTIKPAILTPPFRDQEPVNCYLPSHVRTFQLTNNI